MTEEFVTPEFIDNSDPDTIQSRMMNNLPVDISDMPADFPYDFTMPTAIEISRLIQYNLTRTLMLMFPMWAWGQWLDLHGVSAKVTRKQASRASGHVTVVGTAGTIIEEGTVFCTEGTTDVESVEFATTEEATIPEQGTVDIPVASVLTGASYNVTRNTVTLQKQPNKNVTSVTNENPIRGGTDEEDDDTYRERILEKLRSAEVSFVGCDADYVRWAKEVSGVGSAVVEAEWKGPGTVKVVVADPDGSAVGEETLQAVEDYIVSPKDRMKRLAPIGASVMISTVKDMTISYSAVLLLLLMIVSIFTGLVTEGIKKLLEESKKTYKANFLAGGVAVALSLLVGVGYIILMEAQINSKMAVYLIALVLLSWLSAMVGYDKVIQSLGQIKLPNKNE